MCRQRLIVILMLGISAAAHAQSLGKGVTAAGKAPPADLREALDKNVGQLSRCWEELKKAKPDAKGRLAVSFQLDAAGKMTDLRLTAAAALDTAAFKKCAREVIATWKLPRPPGATSKIVMPVLFGVRELDKDESKAEVGTRAADKPALAQARDGEAHTEGQHEHSAVTDAAPKTPAAGAGATSAPSPTPRKLDAKKGKSGEAKPEPRVGDDLTTPGVMPKEPAAVRPAPPKDAERRVVSAPSMKAGRYDDNKQYNRFLEFLTENQRLVIYSVDVSERLLIRVLDKDGKSLSNCSVDVMTQDGSVLSTSQTYADGATQFFPAFSGPKNAKDYVLAARCGTGVRKGQLSRAGRRVTEVRFEAARSVPARVPVDMAIVLDTTGSMQSQIDRLKTTLQAIHFQLTSLPAKPDIRFALVAYRDRGDDYVTKVWPFTDKVDDFQKVLDGLSADGGGDTPEDMQTALEAAMHQLEWRKDAVRVGFVISDAVPHTDFGQAYNYREAMRESLTRGIKWVTVGAGGLGRDGEVIFRQIAQFSMGEYVFITEGAQGDAEGGVAEASHHVGANYLVENLDQAIVRIIRRELSYLTDSPREVDDTISANGAKGAPRDQVLAPAVAEAMRQLVDYSSMQLGAKTPLAVVPVTAETNYKDVAGYLTDQFALVVSRTPTFKLVERDLQALANEQKLQLSDLFDVTETVPIGKLIGADVLVVAKLVMRGDEADLFAKLVRVETGEVLSVAKVRIAGGVI